MSVEHNAEREVENGFRQYNLVLDIVRYYLEPERPFALRVPLSLDLQKAAVGGVEPDAGTIRKTVVGISKSKHQPPAPHLLDGALNDFCDYVNDQWHEKTAFYLSAYSMWRLNWIHPFTDGNGRTSRALSYTLLCIKLGYILPGSPPIPKLIEEDNRHYIEALESADAAALEGREDVGDMERMLRAMLAKQLMSVIEAAGPISNRSVQ